MKRLSLSSFAAGAAVATVLAAVPAVAVISATDPKPTTYDGTTPSLTLNVPQFRIGTSIDRAYAPSEPIEGCAASHLNTAIPMQLTWSATDATSGIAGYDLWQHQIKFDDATGPYPADTELLTNTMTKTASYLGGNDDGQDCGGDSSDTQYWVVARDNRGNSATTAKTWAGWVDVFQEDGTDMWERPGLAVARTGTWSTATCDCFNFHKTLYSTTAGASLTYTVTTQHPGQTIALVMEKNTNRGKVNVSVDGATATSVDTLASTATHRVIVWQKTLTVGTHKIKLTNAGTSGRTRVDVDSVLLSKMASGDRNAQ